MLPSEIPKLPTDPLVRRFPGIPPSQLPPWNESPSQALLSLFLSLYFVLPPFEENGLPFWVPGVLCQCSEVLWNLLSIQMIF